MTRPINKPRTIRRPREGRVLKVRLGYNANSSSLAAMVSLLMLGSAAAVTVLGIVSAALFARKPQKRSGGNHGA